MNILSRWFFNKVEDLFYNNPTRRKGLRSGAEEHNFIADVVLFSSHLKLILPQYWNRLEIFLIFLVLLLGSGICDA